MRDSARANADEDSRTSTRLLLQARANEENAWGTLVQYYAPRMRMWIRSHGLQDADTADVLQEVFTAVAKGLSQFRRDRPTDSFRAWLRSITHSKLADYHRSRAKQSKWETTGLDIELHTVESTRAPKFYDGSGTDGLAQRNTTLSQIRESVSERDWQIFIRLAVDEHSVADVASEFGISRNAVYIVKSRLLYKARQLAPTEQSSAPQSEGD